MIQAIETHYKGYRMRSRLEARWAVFFDALNIPWEYEKEGFNLGDGIFYLPDFWLPEQQCWIEIKGEHPTEEEHQKANLLAQHSKHDVFLFAGPINLPSGDPKKDFGTVAYRYQLGAELFKHPVYSWHECPYCRKLALCFAVWGGFPCECFPGNIVSAMEAARIRQLEEGSEEDADHIEWWSDKVMAFYDTDKSPRLVRAYTAARSARFEFGEKGGKG